jgi:MFS family permease
VTVSQKEITLTQEKILSKDLLLVMVISFLASTAITTQMGTLPLYVAHLGGTKGDAGTVVGILGISALCLRLPIGGLLDKFGRESYFGHRPSSFGRRFFNFESEPSAWFFISLEIGTRRCNGG